MNFAWPYCLLLLALPAAWLGRELSRARQTGAETHPRIPRAEAGWRGLSPAGGGAGRRRGAATRGWLCAGAALGIVALARPQWGRIEEPVYDQSREVILALDLSRSMLSTDVKPSRLERSKLLIESLLDHLKGERVGLIIFSGTAFLQSPLSADYEILREFLPSLGPAFLPEGGTNYQAMLETALDAFGGGSAADHYLVVLSDGEATDDSWQSKIAALKRRGVHVIGLGVGTERGSMIPDGTGGFVKDDAGAVVLSKLESGTLKQLAEASGGSYRDASTWVDLPALIQATVAAGRKGQFVEHQSVRFAERYQWALAAALLCLLASFWREFPVRTKSRDLRLPASFARSARGRAAPGVGAGAGLGTNAAVGAGAPGGAGTGARAAAGAALLALLALGGLGVIPARASDNPTDENEQPPPETAALDAIVGRLAGQESATATDWSELARETINWGHVVESSHQAVAEGPVRDALAGVSAGERLDPDSKEWANLRSELEQLLKKARERKPPQASNSASDESSQQNPAQQQQQPQNQPPAGSTTNAKADAPPTANPPGPNSSPGDAPPPDKPKSDEANPPTKPDQPGAQSPRPPNRPPNGSSAFGDMTPSSSQGHGPTSQGDQGPQRKVGGTNIRPTADPASKDPALAGSLDKLQQLGDRDSPAELFELMRRGDPAAGPVKKGKTW
jgi:Ca-activated chloride channel family protein